MSELAALYFGKNLMSFLGGAPFAQDLESAFGKIREALPAKSLPYLARIQDLFSARPDPFKDYSKKQDVINGLIDAILHQRRVTSAYFSFNSKKTKSYTLDPYRLVYYRGGLYLYARAEEYGEVRTFAVERIQKIEVLDQSFEMPSDFNVNEYARGAFGIAGGKAETVELLFEAEMASYIRERVWHESQDLEDRPDGSVLLRMQVAPGFELQSWIKGFLPHVAGVGAGLPARRGRHGRGEGSGPPEPFSPLVRISLAPGLVAQVYRSHGTIDPRVVERPRKGAQGEHMLKRFGHEWPQASSLRGLGAIVVPGLACGRGGAQ